MLDNKKNSFILRKEKKGYEKKITIAFDSGNGGSFNGNRESGSSARDRQSGSGRNNAEKPPHCAGR